MDGIFTLMIMGYEATLKITKEINNKYKTFLTEPYDIETERNILLCLCMGDRSETDNRAADYTKLHKEISFAANMYVHVLSENWKYSLKQELENNDNKFYICGRTYGSDSYDEIDDIKKELAKTLMLLCINHCANPFEEETRTYDKKRELVEDTIEDVEYQVSYSLNHQFYNDYLEDDKSNLDESY